MHQRFLPVLAALYFLPACANKSHGNWDNIDYTPVYKAYENRQNDSSYQQPSVISCVDDDLYNCR
jgi:hypothetical protein